MVSKLMPSSTAAGWLRRLVLLSIFAAVPVLAQPVPTAELGSTGGSTGFELDGSLQAVRQSTIAAQVGGTVELLAVRAGDRVKAGQLLARIDARETQAGLQGAEAGVSQAQSALSLARTNAERTRELRRTGFISQAALDAAETELRAAEAGLAQAQAGRAQAALARGFAAVTAPFDAVIQATHVEAGDLAQAGRPLATLYAPGALRAVVQVPSTQSAPARAATDARVLLPGGEWAAAVRRTELPVLDPVSQTYEWRLDLAAEHAARLAPGQAVRVRFTGVPAPEGLASRPTVPEAAVLRRGELTAVYVVDGERFVLRAVRLGASRGDAGVELLAGLKPGERFALDPIRAGLTGAVPAAK